MAKPKKKASRVRRPAPLSLLAAGAPSALPVAPLSLPRPQGVWYGAALLFSAAQPVAGFTLALLYTRQEDRSARIFGYWCLGLGVLGWLLAAMTGALKTALGSGEWFVQPYY